MQHGAAAQLRPGRGGRAGGAREGDQRRGQLLGLLQRVAERVPAFGIVGKPREQMVEHRPGLAVSPLEQRDADEESRLSPLRRQPRGMAEEVERLGALAHRARGAPGEQQRRRMIGAKLQARPCPARRLRGIAALQRDGGGELMQCGIVGCGLQQAPTCCGGAGDVALTQPRQCGGERRVRFARGVVHGSHSRHAAQPSTSSAITA